MTHPIAIPSGAWLDDRVPPSDWALSEARRILTEVLGGTRIRATLFGSRARGNPRPFSDVDIALEGDGVPVPPGLMALLSERLEESCIPYRVDLVDLAHAPESWREAVEKEGIPWID